MVQIVTNLEVVGSYLAIYFEICEPLKKEI
mgnify:CR=1 FL=1